jgi:signal transduction histidine kinase
VIELLVVAAASVALILLVAFVVSRLLRARSRGLSIRLQFFLALAGIVGAFALGLGIVVINRVEARATLLATDAARAEASAIAALVANEVDRKGRRLADVASDLDALGEEVEVEVLAPDGRALAGRSTPDGPGVVSVTVPISVHGEAIGQVRVVKPTIVIERTLADFSPAILLMSVVLGAAAALAAAVIGGAIATPIERLTDFAVRVSEGERRASPPPAHGREVERLSRAIETMRRQLEGRPFVETFAADLSHELKNPVAAIRASAETLADGALEEPEEAARFVERIQEATSRIEALLGDLLGLARIEARGVEDAAQVDLHAIARRSVERATEAGATIELSGQPALVRGDARWLGQMVDNLVDNALVHGREGGVVRVSVTKEGDEQVLLVENEGQIGEHVARRLFRRFVTTRAHRGGTGLGLAIVRAVAEAHAGRAECTSHGPPVVRFRVSLPASRFGR